MMRRILIADCFDPEAAALLAELGEVLAVCRRSQFRHENNLFQPVIGP